MNEKLPSRGVELPTHLIECALISGSAVWNEPMLPRSCRVVDRFSDYYVWVISSIVNMSISSRMALAAERGLRKRAPQKTLSSYSCSFRSGNSQLRNMENDS